MTHFDTGGKQATGMSKRNQFKSAGGPWAYFFYNVFQQQAERGAEAAEGGDLREDEMVVRPKRKLQFNLPPRMKVC